MEVDVQRETGEAEVSACLNMEVSPFFFHGHCHCIKTVIQAQEDGTYTAAPMEDIPQFLSEIRDALKEKDREACAWAKKHGLFYAFDDEGNMLAVVGQRFCLSTDGRLVSETDENDRQREDLSENTSERKALYFIRAKYGTGAMRGIPMPLGFMIEELVCRNGVFTITSSSGHPAVSGTFFALQEALTMIEMLYRTRGVTEEEIGNSLACCCAVSSQ